MSNWTKEKKYGDLGEDMVIKVLEKLGNSITDLSDNKDFFDKDIDLMVNGVYSEIKSSRLIHKTNNLLIEVLANMYNGKTKKGQWRTCEAEDLYYYDTVMNVIYVYKMAELRDFVKNTKKQRQTTVEDDNKSCDCILINKDAVPHKTIWIF